MFDLPEPNPSIHKPIKKCIGCDAPMPPECKSSTGICPGNPTSTFGAPMGYCLVTTGWSPSGGGGSCCRNTTVRKCCK